MRHEHGIYNQSMMFLEGKLSYLLPYVYKYGLFYKINLLSKNSILNTKCIFVLNKKCISEGGMKSLGEDSESWRCNW